MVISIQLLTIFLVGFLDHLGIGLVYPAFTALLFEESGTLLPVDTSSELRGFLYGLLIALTPIAQFFSSPILGVISDKRGRKKVLQLGIGIGVVGYGIAVAGVQFGSILLLLLCRLFIGVADGTVSVAQAAIADMSTREEKSKNFSRFSSVLGIGFTIGPFVGGALADPSIPWMGYATPFLVTGFLCLLNLFLVIYAFPDASNVSKVSSSSSFSSSLWEGVSNLKRAFAWKGLRVYFLSAFAFGFGWEFFSSFIPVTLVREFSFTASQVGHYFAYNSLWYALSAGFLTLPLLFYFSPDRLLSMSLMGGALYMPLFLLIDSAPYLWLYFPVLMFFISIVYPTMASSVSSAARADEQGAVLGVYHSVFSFAFAVAPLFGGAIVAKYPCMTIWGGASSLFLAGVLFLCGRGEIRRHADCQFSEKVLEVTGK